jgi:UDP:flavonoid glycosyltransferase YjiC (YdhE family)
MLFTFAGGAGHFVPLTTIARVAADAGHTVAFAGQKLMMATIAEAGFDAFETAGTTLAEAPVRTALTPVDMEHEYRVVRDFYAGPIARARAAALLALCAEWRPDVLVRDELDFGAAVICERLGLACATVLVIATGALVRPELIAEPLNDLRAEHGLDPDRDLAMLTRYLVFSPFPPSLRDPAFPLPETAHSIRPSTIAATTNSAEPAWLFSLPERRTIYVTLGTVFNVECGDLYERLIAGVRDLPVNVVVTVGNQIDPRDLGPQPAHVRIERYVDHDVLLHHCDAVVCHAGSGTVAGALAHGLPLVLLPMGADQPLNARRCEQLGVGRVLNSIEATPASIRAGVHAVLTESAYRHAAERVRDEIIALPDARYAVSLIERL